MTSLPSKGIRNFRQVTDWLFRGGQPTHKGLEELAEMGIKTVISLRSGRISVKGEQKMAESLGMKFIHVPLSYIKLPDAKTTEQLLQLLDDQSNYPIFIHCFHGADRTGFVVAVFRISRMGWQVQQAYDEMKACGFHRFRLRHFKWVLWSYARRIQKQADRNKQNNLSVGQRY